MNVKCQRVLVLALPGVVFVLLVNVCFCRVRFSYSVPSQEIGWEECLQNDPVCVEWEIKP